MSHEISLKTHHLSTEEAQAFKFSHSIAPSKVASISDFSLYNQEFDTKSEMVLVFFYDTNRQSIGHAFAASGTASVVEFSIRDLIQTVLSVGSRSILLMHNHPSGDVTPSQADIIQTKSILQVLKPLQIVLHDHIIYTERENFSFKSNGLI